MNRMNKPSPNLTSPDMTSLDMNRTVLAVIPARYASTRFPGKPLVMIKGKQMIQWVWELVQRCDLVTQTVVATDDERIFNAVQAFGGIAIMTSPDHPSGTDRVWEVAQTFPNAEIIVNIQGDEPLMDPAVVDRAIEHSLSNPEADMVTLVTPFTSALEWENPNLVKAVLSQSGRALYFSRAALPFYRDGLPEGVPFPQERCYRHLGFYLYRRSALMQFTQLPPAPLELAEKLEQLRALDADMRLDALIVEKAPIGIDHPEDLSLLEQQLKESLIS
jgi:3-deoxy-manno-octulosonate cytidylyltransferase (CMP-KDO synthetase)